MSRVPFTLRIDSSERAALQHMSEVEGRPVNQLVGEAIKHYLGRRGQREAELESSLSALREYRKSDPGFERAIDAFVEAEATLEDPVEGRPVEGRMIEGRLEGAAPVQAKLRELLRA